MAPFSIFHSWLASQYHGSDLWGSSLAKRAFNLPWDSSSCFLGFDGLTGFVSVVGEALLAGYEEASSTSFIFLWSLTLIHDLFVIAVSAYACLLQVTFLWCSCSGSSDRVTSISAVYCQVNSSIFFRLLECHSTWETLRSSQFGLGVLGLESVSLIVGYDSNVPFCSFPQAAACSGSECEKFTSVGEPLSVLVPPAPTPSGASWGTCWASAYRLGSTLDPSCSQGDRRAWPTSCFCRVFPVTGLSTPRPSCAGSPSEL